VPDVKFDDIAGHVKAKKRLNEIARLLKNKDKLAVFNVDAPKGMLLYGPPGTGKTMLAKAFANEAELPFISTTGSELLDIDFIKRVFKRAREYAPAIIFIDEIEILSSSYQLEQFHRVHGSIEITIKNKILHIPFIHQASWIISLVIDIVELIRRPSLLILHDIVFLQ